MAQYRSTIKGIRGVASRLGSKQSGMEADINGWNIGVRVIIKWNDDYDCDEVFVYKTAGSNGGSNEELITSFREKEDNNV